MRHGFTVQRKFQGERLPKMEAFGRRFKAPFSRDAAPVVSARRGRWQAWPPTPTLSLKARDAKVGFPSSQRGRPQEDDGIITVPHHAFPSQPGRSVLADSPLVQTPPVASQSSTTPSSGTNIFIGYNLRSLSLSILSYGGHSNLFSKDSDSVFA
jgi:hypothetical protein